MADELIELIKKVKKGDKDSFVKAVLEIKDQSYRIAFCYLNDEHESMDAVCNAMEKAYIHIKKLKDPKFFKTWFIRIVINEAKLIIRNKNKTIKLADKLYNNVSINNYYYNDHENKMDLQNILKNLAPIDRLAIYMKYYQGYTLNEIADILQMPVGTIKTKIYRNLKKMKSELEYKEG